jgi:autotransporter-associated beta strand protein
MHGIPRTRTCWLLASTALLTSAPFFLITDAHAACVTVGAVTTCDAAAPNPWTTHVGQGNTAAGDNQTINVQGGSTISTGNDTGISLRDGANIAIRAGATVTNAATTTNGQFNTGGNTIEIRNTGTVTIEQGGVLRATGTQAQAEAINFQGTGNTVFNSGTIDADRATAIWSQNTSGLNTVVNTETGIIEAGNGTTSTVIGGSGNGALDFTNRGAVRGSIRLAGGNDILRLFTGSTVTGSFSGGAGSDQIFLSGTGQSTLPGNFDGFESLIKNNSGTWTLSGAIAGVTISDVQQGTLILTGDNTNYTGSIIVRPDGTLEARAQSLPPTVTNDGLTRFAHPDDGTYAGAITGTGAIEKTGAGTLTLSGNTNIAGNTALNEGALVLASSGTLAAASVVMGNATTLQIDGVLTGIGGVPASITAQPGVQTLIINTAFTGNAALGDGDDMLDIAGTVNGNFDQGDGNDTAIIRAGGFLQSGQLSQGAGNDTLDVLGTVQGNVDQGAGDDRFNMLAGTVTGAVTQGDGNDTFVLKAGTINGTVDQGAGSDSFIASGGIVTGNVQQGSGIDDFQMTGGQIQSLNQGDGLDTFFMSDGRIVDYFDDGDNAKMTGGRIGRVNMKLDDNIFDMSGGTIDKNLVTGFGDDTIILSGGTIGGNISVSGGTDSVTVTGGTVGGEVRMSAGNDRFVWDGGGIIYGAIDMGTDNDTALLRNLTDANLGATTQITGGIGTDSLVFDNVKTGKVARFDSWESIGLANDSQLIFDGTLTLGDSGTGTGTVNVDATSTLYGGGANGGIAPFAVAQLANVVNAGRIDLTNGGGSTADTFTIRGNYAGNNGQLFFNTVLGADASASDKLVIDGGVASGTTGMNIINAGGSGATTIQNGIMVVEGVNGANTGSGTFALNGRVAAGAYEYYLFKGGVSAGTGENWYLRSTIVNTPTAPTPAPAPSPLQPPVATPQPEPVVVVAPPPPSALPVVPLPSEGTPAAEPVDPTPPVSAGAPAPVAPPAPTPAKPADPPPVAPPVPTEVAPVPGLAATPPTPGATPVVAAVVPLYRPEVAAYAVAPPVAHELAMTMLGTFHDRRGEQSLLRDGGGVLPATWGRILAQDTQRKWGGTVDPSIDGNLKGFQIGQDLWGREGDGGAINRVGVFFGYAEMDGRVKGQALGWNDFTVGRVNANSTSGGGYWTHVGPTGWYLDGVVMMTWFDGRSRAATGESIKLDGTGVTASLEAGYPFALSNAWTLEAQGQVVWNRLSLDDQADRFSSVSFDRADNGTARLGLRLEGNVKTGVGLFQPNLKANIWREFSGQQTLRFGSDPITDNLDGTTLEVGGGFTVNLTPGIGLFAAADYKANLGGERTSIFGGNAGFSVKW